MRQPWNTFVLRPLHKRDARATRLCFARDTNVSRFLFTQYIINISLKTNHKLPG